MKKLLLISLFLIPNIVIGETCNIPVTKFQVEDGSTAYDHFRPEAIKYCKEGEQLHLNTIGFAERMGILSAVRGNWCDVKYPAYIEIDVENNFSSVTCIFKNHRMDKF